MEASKTLSGSSVLLRLLEQSVIKQYLKQFSPIVRTWLHVDSLKAEEDYLLHELKQQEQGNSLFYLVFDATDTSHLIGAVAIRDPFAHRGQLYCWMHEQSWGTGQFQEALKLATQAYFNFTQRQLLTARVDINNKRSYYALKKSGFADAGVVAGPYGKQYELILRKK